MYQAITTKYFGPTNICGARVKATCDARSRTLPWDYALNHEDNHTRAARALAEELDWQGAWRGGSLPAARGYAFVSVRQNDVADFYVASPNDNYDRYTKDRNDGDKL